MDPLHEASFIGRASSIEEFCSEHMTVSSLSEINSDEKKKNLFEGENQNDNDEHEMLFRPREASVLSKGSPVAHLRVPIMNIVILVCGTRGDVQPFVIIGQLLQSHGHRVRLATHELYQDYIIESGLEFYPLAGDPKVLSAHMVETGGRLLPLTAEEVKAVPEKQQMLEDIMRSTLYACTSTRQYPNSKSDSSRPFKAQAIISNPVTYGHLHCAEYLDIPLHLMFPQPWSPTSAYPHPLSSVHDKRFYFTPTSQKINNNNNMIDGKTLTKKNSSSKLPSTSALDSLRASSSGGSFGLKTEKMTNKEFAMYYDVRLTNRLSYKLSDEFIWLGMRHMTNKFRVDLQRRLRVELKIASSNILKKAGIKDPTRASQHNSSSSPSGSIGELSSHHGSSHGSSLGEKSTHNSSGIRSSLSSNNEDTSSSSTSSWVGMEKIRAGESGANIIHDMKIPFAKMWSSSLIPTPNDYGNHIDIIGNVFAPLTDVKSYQPPPGLLDWLLREKNGKPDPPIFIGFGSMVIKNAASLIATIEEAAKISKRRILLQSSWTDLTQNKKKKQSGTAEGGGGGGTDGSLTQLASKKAQMLMEMMRLSNGKMDPSKLVSLGAAAAPILSDDTDVMEESVEDELFGSKCDDNDITLPFNNIPPPVVIDTNLNNNDEVDTTDSQDQEDKLLFHIGSCPHEWLFPYVDAVVHHGGAGTVAAGLRAGKPTIVCPFFGDQYFWGVALERAKVGLNLGSVSRLTPQKLADGFRSLGSPEMISNAQKMAKSFEEENGALNAVEAFYRHLPLDDMICDVSIWRARNNNDPSSNNNLLISKYLINLGKPPQLLSKKSSYKNKSNNNNNKINKSNKEMNPCSLHVSEEVFNAICRRFRSNADNDLDTHSQDKDMMDVEVPPDVVAGSTFIFQPKGTDPIRVLVPIKYKSGDRVSIKLPSTHKLPKKYPELGEWQCKSCTSLNSPEALATGCICCQEAPPMGYDLIEACAGATGLRRIEKIEAMEREEEIITEDDHKLETNQCDEESKILKQASSDEQVVYDDDSDDEEEVIIPRQRAWSAVGMDLIDPSRDVSVYRGACGWMPPLPKDVASGIYQGTMGFVAQTSQAIGELAGGELTRGHDKFKKALNTLTTKPMLGYKGRAATRRQPRERLMGGNINNDNDTVKLKEQRMRQPHCKKKNNDVNDEHSNSDIDDDHDDGDDKDDDEDDDMIPGGEEGTDEILWRCFDAAASLCICWGTHIGHDVRATEDHRMALSELMVDLGYTTTQAFKMEADAQHQWDSGLVVTMQEVAVFLAMECGHPPNASAITMRHAAQRHLLEPKQK